MRYGFATAGEPMRYAMRKKTLLDAALAIKRGNQMLSGTLPENTKAERDANILRLQSDLHLTFATRQALY